MKMKVRLVAAVMVFASLAAMADNAAKPKRKIPSRAEMIANEGGLVTRSGSMKGKVAFIDTQTRLSADEIKKVIAKIGTDFKFNAVYEKAQPADCPCSLKDASKAEAAIIVIDDPKKPVSLVAPDDHWAMVNVAKLDVNLKTDAAKEKFFAGRCRRQLMRVYAILAGSWTSQYPGNIMAADKLENIDLAPEDLPFDVRQRSEKYLPTIGVTKKEEATYFRACRAGWAPSPTNELQKSIWEDVFKLPTKPIQIKFDPKTDKK